MLECTYIHCTVERDNYERGCTGAGFDKGYSYRIEGGSLAVIKARIASHFGVEDESIVIDPCGGEPSRVDVQRQENDEGEAPTAAEWAAFKAGEIDLWLANYTIYFDEVTRTPAQLG